MIYIQVCFVGGFFMHWALKPIIH